MNSPLSHRRQKVRFLNATDTNNLDFYMFNTLEMANTHSGNISDYVKCTHGINTFKICPNGRKETITSAFADFEPDMSYTVCAVGCGNDISVYTIPTAYEDASLDFAYVRLCMLSRKSSLSDLYANKKCIIGNVKPMNVSRYVAFIPGAYDFEIKKTGSEMCCGVLNNCHLKAGIIYSLFVAETDNPHSLMQLILASD